MSDPEWCDHCGDELDREERCVIDELPVNVTSANEGESATLCRGCYQAVKDCDNAVTMAFIKLERAANRHGPGIGQGE